MIVTYIVKYLEDPKIVQYIAQYYQILANNVLHCLILSNFISIIQYCGPLLAFPCLICNIVRNIKVYFAMLSNIAKYCQALTNIADLE